jgi:hypothetical protein
MKAFIIIVLLSPLFLAAQDCKLNREKDPYTKETKISTGFIQLDGASVTVDADSKEIDMLFSIEGIDKCFDNNSVAAIVFENTKVKMTMHNAGTMNCEGLFHFIFRNTASTNTQLQKLVTQKMTSIVFTGNGKKLTTITFSPEAQSALIALGTCLATEAKTLIK